MTTPTRPEPLVRRDERRDSRAGAERAHRALLVSHPSDVVVQLLADLDEKDEALRKLDGHAAGPAKRMLLMLDAARAENERLLLTAALLPLGWLPTQIATSDYPALVEAIRYRATRPAEPEVLIMIEPWNDDEPDNLAPPFLVCPWDDCHEIDDIRQVDQWVTWNNVTWREDEDGVGLRISDGASDDGEDQGYICGACARPVSVPKDLGDSITYW